MSSDIKMKRVTGTGALVIGRARLRQVHVTTTGTAGRLTITSGSGGEVLLDLDFVASSTHIANIPDEGILSAADPFVSVATNISAATIYYA
jgi:hypothetical protein